jgi:hypothetical protein
MPQVDEFSLGPSVSSTKKTEILMKMVLNTINPLLCLKT